VTSGHPDKVCDQISDAILDGFLAQDPKSRVAVESFGCHGLLIVGGEVTSNGTINAEEIARNVYQKIGYQEPLEVITRIVKQSNDIAQGVDTGGAGDQGIMYGYATNETENYLPYGLSIVHDLVRNLDKKRKSGEISWLKPDGKAQVTVQNGKVTKLLISCQHEKGISQEQIRQELIEKIIKPVLGDISGVEILVNPTGNFEIGGFAADTGLTGRKIMVDTYGGLFPHGGGAFSGKDLTKVDRSAAYMARHVAKNIVANDLAKRCLLSVAYAIGRAEPLMVQCLNEKGEDISKLAREKFDFRPRAIIEYLGLDKPIFQPTAAYGHFGREQFPWERIVKI
jgi:S-adenosylmethionine synthetase